MIFLILLTAISLTNGYPRPRRPMENPDLYHGDIAGVDTSDGRNAVPKDSQRWPNGEIPYIISDELNSIEEKLQKAMDHIEERTCITFVPKEAEHQDYIKFFSGQGCYSHWGRTGGEQPVSIETPGCDDVGIVIHELGHAIGFDHEQNRSDRDEYIEILWQNIEKDNQDQFQKLKPHQNRLLTPYDYDSIMQYGETAFSYNDEAKTMKAKKKGVRLLGADEKGKLSPDDIKRIEILYGCE